MGTNNGKPLLAGTRVRVESRGIDGVVHKVTGKTVWVLNPSTRGICKCALNECVRTYSSASPTRRKYLVGQRFLVTINCFGVAIQCRALAIRMSRRVAFEIEDHPVFRGARLFVEDVQAVRAEPAELQHTDAKAAEPLLP